MNGHQAIALGVAAANIVLIMLFPPFDTYSIAKSQIPVFAGFYFYPSRSQYMVVNSSLLLMELFVVLINAGIAWLLLQPKRTVVLRRRISLQNATLLVVALNLVVIVLFPPFESVYAISQAAIPSFEGFYFIFARQANHVLVSAVLYIEVFFVLINGAIFWLIFRTRNEAAPTPAEAMKVIAEMRRGGG